MSDNAGGDHVCALTGTACHAPVPGRHDGGMNIDRRTMLTQSMLAAAAAALAACGVSDLPSSPASLTPFTFKVSNYASLGVVGGVALVSSSGTPIAVVRTSDTTYVALSRICPHQGATVGLVSGGFLCPQHGAQFDLSGAWIGGQPTGSMQRYAATYDAAAGTLTIG